MGVNPREGRRAGGTCREVPSGEGVCDGRTASVSVGLAQQREMCVTQRQLEEQSARAGGCVGLWGWSPADVGGSAGSVGWEQRRGAPCGQQGMQSVQEQVPTGLVASDCLLSYRGGEMVL